MENHHEAEHKSLRHPFEMVAVWQFLCFIALIAFVWASEVLDIKHLVYDAPEAPVDWLKASLLTAAILVIAVITVGQTYLQEKRILRGFIIVCSYCHKVQVEKEAWQQMESYVSGKTLAEFSHGVCPSCYDRVLGDLERTPKAATKS